MTTPPPSKPQRSTRRDAPSASGRMQCAPTECRAQRDYVGTHRVRPGACNAPLRNDEPFWRTEMSLTVAELAAVIDHTLLKPDATEHAIVQLCAEARAHRFASVCIQPYWVSV